MLDAVTLDQLRTLLAVVEAGSFSAAARRLKRVQSAVSQAMSNLEQLLGVTVWDRSTRIPTLTDQGRVILASAQRVCAQVDALKRVAEGLAGGLEPSVSLVVDAVFPVTALVDLCREFARAFPTVELRLSTETLSAVTARVLDGSCQIGVAGPAAEAPGLTRRHLTYVRMIPVCSATHPLAALRGRIPTARAAEHVQIVFSERGADDKAPDQAVLSPQTWRVVDLGTKHALLRPASAGATCPSTWCGASSRGARCAACAWRPGATTITCSRSPPCTARGCSSARRRASCSPAPPSSAPAISRR
jgi:DNA-binding transcriptional LysR family regulator